MRADKGEERSERTGRPSGERLSGERPSGEGERLSGGSPSGEDDRLPAFVDCHHHLWDIDKHRYEWLEADPLLDTFLGDYSALCRNYLLEDYLRDAASSGLVKSVHVQCEFDPSNPVGETEWLQGVADEHGFPHGIVGYADLSSPAVGKLLEAHALHANFRGIRQTLNFDADNPRFTFVERGDLLSDGAWRKGFAILGELGFSYDLQVLPHQLADGYDLAAAFPETRIVLNHVGLPIIRSPEVLEVWRSGMRQLASLPNVFVKLSGFGMMEGGCSDEAVRPIALETIETFGVQRCMFGSNFPVDGLQSSFDDMFAAYRRVAAEFSDDEQAALFGGTAERFYRI